jgi:uncharacterized protein (DUF4415 family)
LKTKADEAAEAARRAKLAEEKAAQLAAAGNEEKIVLYTTEIDGYQTRINEIFTI